VRGGADSLLVLTGVVGLRELVQAPAGSRPTYVSTDLRGLLQPHPEVEVDLEGARGQARCGGVTAGYEDGLLRANDSCDDGVRALAALAWACTDRGLPVRLA
jgi:hypothetical protein